MPQKCYKGLVEALQNGVKKDPDLLKNTILKSY